ALLDVAASEADFLTGREHEAPRAALVEVQRVDRQMRVDQPLAQLEIKARDLALAAVGTGEPRQLRKRVIGALGEQLAARVQQPFVAPARRGAMLGQTYDQRVGPRAAQLRPVDPRERLEAGTQRLALEGPEPGLERRRDRGLDLQ